MSWTSPAAYSDLKFKPRLNQTLSSLPELAEGLKYKSYFKNVIRFIVNIVLF